MPIHSKIRLRLGLIMTLVLLAYVNQKALAQTGQVPLYDNLGEFHFEISSSNALAQQYFDQGMRLYYAFNHPEAIRAFRQAQQLDDECAICWWGEALAWGPNINLPMDQSAALTAYAAIQEAEQRRSHASPREQALIHALAKRYTEAAPADRAPLDQAYADAMGRLNAAYPDDPDISVLYAESLMTLRPWDYWTADREPKAGIKTALDRLTGVMATNPAHPGACHFYIHAVEAVFPERAVECAERLASLMPGAGHLVHMPGHIYIRVGRYLDAVKANEHAVHADESYIRDHQPGPGMYTVGYYPHNYDFMAFAAMMIGRGELSVESARKVTSLLPREMFGTPGMDFLQAWSVRPLLMQVRFARWQEILDTDRPAATHLHANGIWHYARGRALLAKGQLAAAAVELKELRLIASRRELASLRMEFNNSADLLAIAENVLNGHLQAARGHMDAAVAALEEAVRREDNLFYGEPPEWSVPPRQDLGAILLLANRPEQAERVFREDLAKFPQNGWSLYGAHLSLARQGKTAAAAEALAEFERVWSTTDLDISAAW